MVAAAAPPAESANPNPKPKNAYHIGGIQVEFPYQPYGSQLAFMGRLISTLDRALKDGHCHALLESPTGTGKSLSLLCSTLAWQHNFKSKNLYANLTPSSSKPNPEAITDPLGHGGGFIPETQPSRNLPSSVTEPSQAATSGGKSQKKKAAPTIYYASRTHSQISQVIREYRKTAYRVPMAVLASRKHYCTNKHVNGKENMDEECKLLLRDREAGCLQFKNAHKVRGHPSLQKGGCHEVHDIEDLVKVGKVVKGCSYYAARSMAEDAQLVFCPYSYIINPVIRGAMEVDIKGAILILDEAHNIEDIARDSGSVDVEEDVLHKLQMELEQLCTANAMIYQPLYEMTQDLLSWIERKKSTLEKREFQHYYSCWTGDKALRELQESNISQQCFPILLDCATKAIKAAADTESEEPHLSGLSVIVLEGLFSSLTFFFSRNGCYISDFQLALQRCLKRDRRNAVGEWTTTFSLWCLNPAVVFKDIADLSLSVILTSGTLSPMNSFSSELGVQFGTCLEAPHVIDVESQVWASVISTGPGNYPLNASYKTADDYVFQDALGKSLEEICKIVPAGSLVFFPSYKLMEKLCSRWRETGQWSRLNARKPLFVVALKLFKVQWLLGDFFTLIEQNVKFVFLAAEPRGGSQEDFDSVLKDYYDRIRGGDKHVVGRKKRVKKMDADPLKATESTDTNKKGAAFLAVCRGKVHIFIQCPQVSEGIDFSDDNARVVIIVGIPFPNLHDVLVGAKKKYNDTYKTSKNLLSGSEWYCHQAFRALNQAAGRCIRHRFDYGAIILLDERYKEERNRLYISKWLRKSIQLYDSFDASVEGLKSFFRDTKEIVSKNTMEPLINSHANGGQSIPSKDHSKGCTRNRNQKLNKGNTCGGKLVCSTNCNDTFPELTSQIDTGEHASVQIDDNLDSCKEIIDLESVNHKESRFFHVYSHEDPEIIIVKETPAMGESRPSSSESFTKDGNSNSTLIQVPPEFTDQFSLHMVSLTNPIRTTCKAQSSVVVTPEKQFTVNTCSLIPEAESTFNLSVNSRMQKRRKCMGSPLMSIDGDHSDVPIVQTPGSDCFARSSITVRDATRKIEFGLESNFAENKSTKSAKPLVFPRDCSAAPNVACGPVMDKRLQISCSLCKSPLGLPENDLYVSCSLTSSSKVHLVSLVKERSENCLENTSTCTPVLMTDISSVNLHPSNSTIRDTTGQGVWCEEDGCVFNSVFCPFCSTSNCLGVQVMATNASNVQLLDKDLLSANEPRKDNTLNSKDRFSYSPKEISGGWRTTKSKLRLPKSGVLCNGQDC
ncbi:hypothetical protein Tsubulata_049121 [Turnera subulata]|uniref:Helicase ATP-binding domain-containing protein n=1 Tax=Turnera subulata TaxID=218843 RepID=A0A9Q0FB38_9ROSI|nr:hypothetical protein Tsubulata_049121 [Turnera subulata]